MVALNFYYPKFVSLLIWLNSKFSPIETFSLWIIHKFCLLKFRASKILSILNLAHKKILLHTGISCSCRGNGKACRHPDPRRGNKEKNRKETDFFAVKNTAELGTRGNCCDIYHCFKANKVSRNSVNTSFRPFGQICFVY